MSKVNQQGPFTSEVVLMFKSTEPLVQVAMACKECTTCRMVAGKLSFANEVKYVASDFTD